MLTLAMLVPANAPAPTSTKFSDKVKFCKFTQPENNLFGIMVNVGIVTWVKAVQFSKTESPKLCTFCKFKETKLAQPAKAEPSIMVTLSRFIFFKEVKPENVFAPIVEIRLDSVMFAILLFWYALPNVCKSSSIFSAVSGVVNSIDVMAAFENALLPTSHVAGKESVVIAVNFSNALASMLVTCSSIVRVVIDALAKFSANVFVMSVCASCPASTITITLRKEVLFAQTCPPKDALVDTVSVSINLQPAKALEPSVTDEVNTFV